MFEIGFPELVLIAIVGLLVIGPERLPEALRTLGLWLGRMRRSFTTVKAEIEKEIGMDEVKRQLHNEAILEEMKRIESEVKGTVDSARDSLNQGVQAAEAAGAPTGEPQKVEPDHSGADVDEVDHSDAGRDDRDHADAGADETARADPAAPGGAPPTGKQAPAPPQADAMDYAIGNVATPPDDAEKASDRANNG